MSEQDRVVTFFRSQVAEWRRSIALMESEQMWTREKRDGLMVDTTAGMLTDLKARKAELDALIAVHEGRNA